MRSTEATDLHRQPASRSTKSKTSRNSHPTQKPYMSWFLAFLISSIVLAPGLAAFTSWYLHGNLTYNYNNQFTNIGAWKQMFKTPVNLTEAQLATFDGTNGKPIYLAVNGSVYDVSASPELYGPGGSYSFFTGKDGARAYITGCFATDLTHDLRGVPEKDWVELVAWKLFYETHGKYFKVGVVHHPPIDPRIPPPAPCNAQRRGD